jgi:gamma-glutamyl-gamma-aminobutyrate hydrolase PuuD
VIEAIRDPSRPFCVGVQWHPERTPDRLMGDGIVQRLIEASR